MKFLNKILKGIISIMFFLKYKILFGKNIKIHAINSIKGKLSILLKEKSLCKVGKFLMIDGPLYLKAENNSKVLIGDYCYFNHNCSITALNSIIIGNNCMFGNNVVIVDHNHLIKNEEISGKEFEIANVKIGNNVWIGANAVILQGVEIGDNSVVAAGAVVTKNIGKKEIWGGVPAKKIKDISDER